MNTGKTNEAVRGAVYEAVSREVAWTVNRAVSREVAWTVNRAVYGVVNRTANWTVDDGVREVMQDEETE